MNKKLNEQDNFFQSFASTHLIKLKHFGSFIFNKILVILFTSPFKYLANNKPIHHPDIARLIELIKWQEKQSRIELIQASVVVSINILYANNEVKSNLSKLIF